VLKLIGPHVHICYVGLISLEAWILEPRPFVSFDNSSGISFSWKEPPPSFRFSIYHIDRPQVVVADAE
jgi:hypothetical protein